MRKLASFGFALLLLALMPAFALLRYEHSLGSAREQSVDPAQPAAGGRPEASAARGPSLLGSHVNAASPAIFFERTLALAALEALQDSLPRPPDAPPPRWQPAGGTDSTDVSSPVAFLDVPPGCAGVARGQACRGDGTITLIAFRLLSYDLERAEMLADWRAGRQRGTFYILFERDSGVWRPVVIARAGVGYTERPGS